MNCRVLGVCCNTADFGRRAAQGSRAWSMPLDCGRSAALGSRAWSTPSGCFAASEPFPRVPHFSPASAPCLSYYFTPPFPPFLSLLPAACVHAHAAGRLPSPPPVPSPACARACTMQLAPLIARTCRGCLVSHGSHAPAVAESTHLLWLASAPSALPPAAG